MKKQFDIKKARFAEPALSPDGAVYYQLRGGMATGSGGKCFREIPFSVCCPAWGAAKFLAQPAPVGSAGRAVLRCWPASGGVPQK